jgi:hypothetical protein
MINSQIKPKKSGFKLCSIYQVFNILRILIFFTIKQGDYCKILKFDLHVGYEKEFADLWNQLSINLLNGYHTRILIIFLYGLIIVKYA